MTKIESVVKTALLNGKDFQTRRGWIIKISQDDKVQIWPPKGEGRETTLAFLDKAVKDFCKQADVMAPGVNETNAPKSTSDGSLGKDTSGKSPKKFDPSVNKTPKPDGSFTDKSLGSDTSMDEAFATPSINKDMTPDDEGLTDTDLGSDSSGNSTKFDNKVVNVQSDGRTGKKAQAHPYTMGGVPDSDEGKVFGDTEIGDLLLTYHGGMNTALYEVGSNWLGGHGVPADAVSRAIKELEKHKTYLQYRTENGLNKGDEGDADEIEELVAYLYEVGEGGGGVDEDHYASKNSKIQDTFANGPDPSEIYRKLNAKKVSKELLNGILNADEWEATQRLAQMDKNRPKRGPGMPGKGKGNFSEGPGVGGQIGAEDDEDITENEQYNKYFRPYEKPNRDEEEDRAVGGKKSLRTAGPKLREKWLNDGGYHREIESESAEELHALVQGFGGEDVDWAKFKPAMPEDKDAEAQQQPVQEGAGAAPITAKKAQFDDDSDWETNPEYWAESYINGNISDCREAINSGKVNFFEVLDAVKMMAGPEKANKFDWTMQKLGLNPETKTKMAQSADVEAVDEEAKETINNYFGEYGKELTKDDGVAPKGKNPKKMLDKGKRGQAAPPPATPAAPAPAAPGGPGAAPAPGGQPAAPAPKAPAPKAPQGLQPGVGDAGIQALGWTAEDVQSMTDEQKKGILQIKLTKPGTEQKPQMQPKTPAPKTPAPGGPGTPPAGPQSPAAPGSEPAPPAPSAPSPKAVKGIKKGKKAQAAPLPETEEAPAAPAQEAPQSPAAPGKAPATPAAPKGPAKPAGGPAADPGQAGGGQEQQAFQILQEVQQMQVNAATPNEVGTAKVSQLLQRLLTELGITPDQASKLFGLQRGNFGTLFK